MDPKERLNSLQVAMDTHGRALQARMWTSLPGIIEAYDAARNTATVQPAIRGITSDATGAPLAIDMPLLLDCPVIFPRGGGFTMTFPVRPGDECLVHFAARCIDGWWQSGGIQPPLEYRKHDLSDGFVQVGPMSQAELIDDISTTAAELRSDDGANKVKLDASGLTLQAGGAQVALTTAGLTITVGGKTFAFTSTGFAQTGGTIKHDGINIGKDHKHTLVTPGVGDSGPPSPV